MGTDFKRRIIVDGLICLSIFLLPWWANIFFILAPFFIFNHFYEGFLLGLVADLIYFIPHKLFFNLPVVFILAVAFFFLSIFLDKQLRIRNK